MGCYESIRISTNTDDIDTKLVVREIQNSYWGRERSEDHSTFAYLCGLDVS